MQYAYEIWWKHWRFGYKNRQILGKVIYRELMHNIIVGLDSTN